MIVLQVALYPFGTELSLIHRKIIPGLEADHVIVPDFELNAALHATKAAVRLDQMLGSAGPVSAYHHRVRMRAVTLDQSFFG